MNTKQVVYISHPPKFHTIWVGSGQFCLCSSCLSLKIKLIHVLSLAWIMNLSQPYSIYMYGVHLPIHEHLTFLYGIYIAYKLGSHGSHGSPWIPWIRTWGNRHRSIGPIGRLCFLQIFLLISKSCLTKETSRRVWSRSRRGCFWHQTFTKWSFEIRQITQFIGKIWSVSKYGLQRSQKTRWNTLFCVCVCVHYSQKTRWGSQTKTPPFFVLPI